jgi:PBP1b-binding outer membrane lipoprotein LpoB
MKRNYFFVLFFVVILIGCNQNATTTTDAAVSTTEATTSHGQSGVQDETSAPDVVKIAVGSKDHTTLVTALQAADLVNALSNAGRLRYLLLLMLPLTSCQKALWKGCSSQTKKML